LFLLFEELCVSYLFNEFHLPEFSVVNKDLILKVKDLSFKTKAKDLARKAMDLIFKAKDLTSSTHSRTALELFSLLDLNEAKLS